MSDALADLTELEQKEINQLYPVGTIEREALEYSMGKPGFEEIHPVLRFAFKVLVGASILMAISTIITLASS